MIDTHSHIYLEEFDADRAEVVRRAKLAGLRHIILPNVDLETVSPMQTLAAAYPDYMSMAMGLHPTSVGDDYKEQLSLTRKYFEEGNYVAVGEVGIDLYWDATYRVEQMEAFDEQLRWAEEKSLPVIIHSRDALAEILAVFKAYRGTLPPCVFHSFGGSVEDVRRIREFGDFLFGINGVVTFKNSKLYEVLPEIGLDHILLETDCPYLTPVPYRGKRNESSYVPYIAQKIAETMDISVDTVSEQTDNNAIRFFNLEV